MSGRGGSAEECLDGDEEVVVSESGEDAEYGEVSAMQGEGQESCGEDGFGEVTLPKLRGSALRPTFGKEEEVKMDPTIFLNLCN